MTTAQEFTQVNFLQDMTVQDGLHNLLEELQAAACGQHRGYNVEPQRQILGWVEKLHSAMENLTGHNGMFLDTYGMVYVCTGWSCEDSRAVAFGPRGTSIPLDIHVSDDYVKNRTMVVGVDGWTYLV